MTDYKYFKVELFNANVRHFSRQWLQNPDKCQLAVKARTEIELGKIVSKQLEAQRRKLNKIWPIKLDLHNANGPIILQQ